jgi:hypothetical protein
MMSDGAWTLWTLLVYLAIPVAAIINHWLETRNDE